ncbi:hypothetical protein VNO77_37832 [Canavalia gladiata]|uniref:Uncharacterized protein n=1 Tax=Canavalia gladiata TaxID=3824 RepID=A0AAN9K990_CANGL
MNCHNSAQQVKPACLVVSLRDAQARQKCPELFGIRSLDSAEKQEGKPDHGRLTVSHSSSGWERCGFKSLSGFKIGVSLQRAVSSLVCASLFTQGREEIEIGPSQTHNQPSSFSRHQYLIFSHGERDSQPRVEKLIKSILTFESSLLLSSIELPSEQEKPALGVRKGLLSNRSAKLRGAHSSSLKADSSTTEEEKKAFDLR